MARNADSTPMPAMLSSGLVFEKIVINMLLLGALSNKGNACNSKCLGCIPCNGMRPCW